MALGVLWGTLRRGLRQSLFVSVARENSLIIHHRHLWRACKCSHDFQLLFWVDQRSITTTQFKKKGWLMRNLTRSINFLDFSQTGSWKFIQRDFRHDQCVWKQLCNWLWSSLQNISFTCKVFYPNSFLLYYLSYLTIKSTIHFLFIILMRMVRLNSLCGNNSDWQSRKDGGTKAEFPLVFSLCIPPFPLPSKVPLGGFDKGILINLVLSELTRAILPWENIWVT